MSSFFLILLAVVLISLVGVLFLGLYSMARGGPFNEKYANKLMQARVILQGLAIVLLILAYYTTQG